MSIDEIIEFLGGFEGVLTLKPPVYGNLGWLAVVNPSSRTETAIRELLRTAHDLARPRYQRRAGSTLAPSYTWPR